MIGRLQRITVTLDRATPPPSPHPDPQPSTGLRPVAVYCAQARLELEKALRRRPHENESKLRVASRLFDCMVRFFEEQEGQR